MLFASDALKVHLKLEASQNKKISWIKISNTK